MQETKVLYTANEGSNAMNGPIPRWMDALKFFGVIFVIGSVLGGSLASGDPSALWFVKVALGVMVVSVGVFILMLLLNWAGLWGLWGLVPLALLGVLWVTGVSGQTFFQHLGQGIMHGVIQVLKIGCYGCAGVASLGLLARLLDKVGVWGFITTIAIAIGTSIWIIK